MTKTECVPCMHFWNKNKVKTLNLLSEVQAHSRWRGLKYKSTEPPIWSGEAVAVAICMQVRLFLRSTEHVHNFGSKQ